MNEVIVLFDGYSEVINQTTSLANCTCTLIKGKNSCTIVDTRTAWDGAEIVNGTVTNDQYNEINLISFRTNIDFYSFTF